MSVCLSPELIERYVTGGCSAEEAETVSRHVAACDACRWEIEAGRANEASLGRMGTVVAEEGEHDQTTIASTVTAVSREPCLPPSDSFTGYEIIWEIHRGGQGIVYQAVHKSTKRKVAIKVMKEGPFVGRADKARFDREVHVLGQLKHPNIVAIHDTGGAAGSHFFVMD